MPSFNVKYKNDPESESQTIKAPSHVDAYVAFMELDETRLKKDLIIIKGGFPIRAETFDDHLEVIEAREEEKRIKEANAQQSKMLYDYASEVKEKGFANISFSKIQEILKIVERTLCSDNFSEEDFRLTQMIISDPAAYRFLTLRLSHLSTLQQQSMLEAMNANLSEISNKTTGVRAASLFTGFAAARHIGEQMGEDFGGGDE